MHQGDLRDADDILARFPGPVTLTMTRPRKLAMLAAGLGILVICAWFLTAGPPRPPSLEDTVIIWFGVLLGGWLTGLSVTQLLAPARASLTLDADGFEVATLFRRDRTRWRDVSEFRFRWFPAVVSSKLVQYDVPGAKRARTRMLPDGYGLSMDDLRWLLNAWRARALMHSPARTSVPTVDGPG